MGCAPETPVHHEQWAIIYARFLVFVAGTRMLIEEDKNKKINTIDGLAATIKTEAYKIHCRKVLRLSMSEACVIHHIGMFRWKTMCFSDSVLL